MATEIKIQPCKTKLFQSEVEYLGQNVQQRRSFDDSRVHTEDQRLASTKEWQGGSYVPMICRVLSHLHPTVLCVDLQVVKDQESQEVLQDEGQSVDVHQGS